MSDFYNKLKKTFRDIIENYGTDFLFIFLSLLIYFLLFYSKWPVWIDQAIHLYMAWGLLNGMTPYVDIANVHLPGVLLIHLIARLISGLEPFGLRLLDICFIFLLLASSSVILRNFGVNLPLRIAGITVYLVFYFSSTFWDTAQKESFSLPLTVLGLIPLFSLISNKNEFKYLEWFFFGAILSFGLWTKVTPAFIVFYLILFSLYAGKKDFYNTLKKYCFYLSGFFLVCIFFISWMILIGSFEGFLKWPLGFSIGPFLKAKWPLTTRLLHTAINLWSGNKKWTLVYVLVSFIFLFLNKSFVQVVLEKKKELFLFFGLVVIAYLSIFIQGKTHCSYHFIVLHWSLMMLGSFVFSLSDVSKLLDKSSVYVILCCILTLFFTGNIYASREPVPHVCTLLAEVLNKHLKPDETVVEFGFCTPLHLKLERKTPFPYLASIGLYNTSPPGSPMRDEIISSLVNSLKDPGVKYFVVDSRKPMPFYSEINEPYKTILEKIGEEKLQNIGFTISDIKFSDFVIYERRK